MSSRRAIDTGTESLVVVVTVPFPDDGELREALTAIAPNIEVHWTPYWESAEIRASKGANGGRDPQGHPAPDITAEMREIWKRAHVVIGIDLPTEASDLWPNLQWFQAISAGVDQLDLNQLAAMGARLANASGIASVSIAEFVIARFLEVWKNLREIEAQQVEQDWTVSYGTEVAGSTLLIAGLGSIGREVAKRARAFGIHVIATRASARPGDSDPDVDELHPAAALDDLLGRCDAVLCCLPASTATTDMFNHERFAMMKPGAIFCNVGRGIHVVEADLIEALNSNHLRAAILDVTRVEPTPVGDPLWTVPNLYLSPHSAISTDNYQQNAWSIVATNFRRLLTGERLHNEVDLPKNK